MRSFKEREAEAILYTNQGLKRVSETPQPGGQKFPPGSFVWIAKYLGKFMPHFDNDRPARISHTYAHAFGGNDTKSYCLLIRADDGHWHTVSWYEEWQLTIIEDIDLIEKYKFEIETMSHV